MKRRLVKLDIEKRKKRCQNTTGSNCRFIQKLVDKVTLNPARLWGIYPKKGTIAVASDADLVLVDLNKEFVVDYRNLHSASDWSLYQDKTLTGQPIMTIKNGKVVMREGEIIEQRGMGKRLRKSN